MEETKEQILKKIPIAPNRRGRQKFIPHNLMHLRKKSNDIFGRGIHSVAPASKFDNVFLSPSAAQTLAMDSSLSPVQKAIAINMVREASKDKGGIGFTTTDLVRAGIGAGLGYGAAAITGKTLGSVFGLNPKTQKTLARIGAVGGLLKATGVWK